MEEDGSIGVLWNVGTCYPVYQTALHHVWDHSFSFFLYFSIPLFPHFKISYSQWTQMKYDCIFCIQVCVDIWQKCKGFHCEHIMNECNTFTTFFSTLECLWVPHVIHAHKHVPSPAERCFMLWRLPDQKQKTTVHRMKYHIWNMFCGNNFYETGRFCKENELA